MGSEWGRQQVSEVCELIVDCVNKTAPKVGFETPYKMIRTTNVRNSRVNLGDCKYVEKEVFEKWTRRARVEKGDVLLTREAPIGEVGRIAVEDTVFLGQRLMQYRANKELLDPRFLLYSFLSPDLKHQFNMHEGTGSVVSHIRVPDCFKFEISLPPLPEQKAIAHILGSLDDKIELNRQMNETLEAMAQALFKSWFVDFDPVIDNALAAGNDIPEALASRAAARQALGDARKPLPEDIRQLFPSRFEFTEAMGCVPEGWGAGVLSDITEKITDGSHQSPPSVDTPVGFPMASSKDLTSEGICIDSCRSISRNSFNVLVNNGCKPHIGDILISKDGSRCGETCCIHDFETEVVLLSSVAIVRPKISEYSIYINTLFSRKESIVDLRENYVSGSAIPRIVLRDFKRFPVIIPSEAVIKTWNDLVFSKHRKRRSNNTENRSLEQLRDTLLPKLLSGELRISDAEKFIQEAKL